MPLQVDIADIQAKNARLDAVGAELMQHFVGIDAVITSLIDAMRVWYVMPDVLVRPVIINLWGMTGVGKTDLVRRLVKGLNMQDRFAEVELSNIDQTMYYSSVTSVLENHHLNDTEPKILFFDEMQRFNTLDHEGKPVPALKFGDFWELLSDGRLSKRTREDLDDMVFSFQAMLRDQRARKLAGEEVEVDPRIGIWEGRNLKLRLGLSDDLDMLAGLRQSEAVEQIRRIKERKAIYEPVDHSRSLIIISGNLDEAFTMAGATDEADVDADIFHAFTQKITMVDIKRALARRFKPEQVARFGNVHLVYQSQTKAGYQTIIAREIARIATQTHERFGVHLQVDKSISELIYRNGVFPVQGVRPVYSSVTDILEANLSKLLFEALARGEDTISLRHDGAASELVAQVGARTINIPFVGRVDAARARSVGDMLACLAAHEAGHAVAYMAKFALAPLQLSAKVASQNAAAFMFPHDVLQTRGSIMAKVQVYLAGGLAEDMMFGQDNATAGRANDREQATALLVDCIRRYGFHESFQANYALDGPYYMDRDITDQTVEKMMRELVAQTRTLLEAHRPLHLALVRRLQEQGEITAEEVARIAGEHGMSVSVAPEGHQVMPAFASMIPLAGSQEQDKRNTSS